MSIKLGYTDTGKGPAIVLIHGFCESKNYWTDAVTALSPQFRVITFDVPGYGESEAIDNFTLEAVADAFAWKLELLGVQKALFVGHSMGGYIALALAERHAGLMAGLCMFHSTAYEDSEEKKAQRDKTIRYLNDNGVEAFIRPFVPPLFYAKNRQKCEAAIAQITEEGLKLDLKVIAASVAAMRDRPERTHVLTDANYPVLYIVGKNDASVKLEDSISQLHLAPKSYAQILDDTGHQGFFEKQEETLAMLKAFAGIVFA